MGFKADRLRVNLRLLINRLKLLEKKKTELAQKARKDIADQLAAGKDERARIRVEQIIREDYLVEALEILELYCELLLSRFGFITGSKHLPKELMEPISTLIWAAPSIEAEAIEIKVVSDQLCAKYSSEYGKLCRANTIGTVNDRLVHKLDVKTFPKILVERYLIEIAKNYNVPYESDAMVQPELHAGAEADLIDVNHDKKFGGGGCGGGGGGGGFSVPPGAMPMHMPMPMPMPTPFNYPPPKGAGPFNPAVGTYNNFQHPMGGGHPPQLPTSPPTYESIDDLTDKASVPSQAVGPVPSPRRFDSSALPELPSVPDTLPTSSFGRNTTTASDDIDFDDLTRRFEELKKKS